MSTSIKQGHLKKKQVIFASKFQINAILFNFVIKSCVKSLYPWKILTRTTILHINKKKKSNQHIRDVHYSYFFLTDNWRSLTDY